METLKAGSPFAIIVVGGHSADLQHAPTFNTLNDSAIYRNRPDKPTTPGPTMMQEELTTARKCLEAGDLQQAERAYRNVLDTDPRNADALDGLGLLAIRAGDFHAAVDLVGRAIEADGSQAAMHDHMGVAWASLRQYDRAVESLRRAIDLDPRAIKAHCNLGRVLRFVEKPDEAVTHYRAALAVDPESPEVHYSLANTLRDLGRLDEAVAAYRDAVRLRPEFADALNNLGNVLRDLGQLDEAAAAHREAIRLRPDYAEGHRNLGLVLGTQKKHDEAAACFRKALQLDPDFAAARNNLGKALAGQGKLDEAVDVLPLVDERDKTAIEVRLALAEKLVGERRFDEAVARFEEVLAIKADLPTTHLNLGLVFFAKEDLDGAVACWRRAIEIKPDCADAYVNLSLARGIQGHADEALRHIETALQIQPDFAAAHITRAVAWLRMGNFEQGWKEYEWRQRRDEHPIDKLSAPLWDGRTMTQQTILLHAEQGLGDSIQFVRYAPAVKQRCGTVILACHEALKPLLSRCRGVDRVIVRGDNLPKFDAYVPLLSLPGIFGTTFQSVPDEVPYISIDDELIESWRERLGGRRGFKVGIGWQGSTQYKLDNFRSVALQHFAPLSRVAGVELFSLQKGKGSEQLAELADRFPITDFGPRFDETSGPFMDTAAAMKNLDLVISSDTSIVHLAGALGVPVWVVLSYSADWRWFEQRADSPWYPTMRLFRQTRIGDWDELLHRVAGELADVVAGNA